MAGSLFVCREVLSAGLMFGAVDVVRVREILDQRAQGVREFTPPESPEEELRGLNSIELDRTASNSNKLGRDEKDDKNPMNYEEWSKSIELEQTLTPNSVANQIQWKTAEDL